MLLLEPVLIFPLLYTPYPNSSSTLVCCTSMREDALSNISKTPTIGVSSMDSNPATGWVDTDGNMAEDCHAVTGWVYTIDGGAIVAVQLAILIVCRLYIIIVPIIEIILSS